MEITPRANKLKQHPTFRVLAGDMSTALHEAMQLPVAYASERQPEKRPPSKAKQYV